jgi:hypothetical protein
MAAVTSSKATAYRQFKLGQQPSKSSHSVFQSSDSSQSVSLDLIVLIPLR